MYKKLYFSLFNAVTDAIDQLERQEFQSALTTLELAQRNCEELFIQGEGWSRSRDRFRLRGSGEIWRRLPRLLPLDNGGRT